MNESLQNLTKQTESEKQKQQEAFDSFKKSSQDLLQTQNDKINQSLQNLISQAEKEKQKQQNEFDSFKQFTQDQLKIQKDNMNESLKNLKIQLEKENKNTRDEAETKINTMKSLVDKNNSRMDTFITKDILFKKFVIKFIFKLFDLISFYLFIEFQHHCCL